MIDLNAHLILKVIRVGKSRMQLFSGILLELIYGLLVEGMTIALKVPFRKFPKFPNGRSRFVSRQ